MKKIFFILFFLIFLLDYSKSQNKPSATFANSNLLLDNISRFPNSDVNYYTGVANIKIPLQNINVRDYNINLNLNYYAKGIKVEQEATYVGLGWDLNYGGGTIVRQAGQRVPGDPCNKINNSLDNYNYSFGNHNGKFYIDEFGKGIIVDQEDLKISYFWSTEQIRFEIVDVDGTIYKFNTSDYSNLIYYLTDIQTVNNNTIHFNYTKAIVADYSPLLSPRIKVSNFVGESHVASLIPGANGDPSNWEFDDIGCRNSYHGGVDPDFYAVDEDFNNHLTQFQSVYIQDIITDNSKISFEYDDRTDLSHYNYLKPKKLKKINIYSINNDQLSLIVAYQLNYEYSDVDNKNTLYSKRLLLTSVNKIDTKGNRKSICKIDYNTTNLPLKSSYNQDHWGYYNGEINNPSLHPAFGANRETDGQFTAAGMINTITNIFGGKTTFEFESNEYYDEQSLSNKKGGGVRIKSIIQNDGQISNVQVFEYSKELNNTNISSGKLLTSIKYTDVFGVDNFQKECYPKTRKLSNINSTDRELSDFHE